MPQKKENIMLIPWAHSYEWLEMTGAIVRTLEGRRPEITQLERIAEQIHIELEAKDRDLDIINGKSCVYCQQVCCKHATVWYDLRDLLFLYLANKKFPKQQIHRENDGSCSNLTNSGCAIPRNERPFICTWYICSRQKDIVQEFLHVLCAIEKIQGLRKKLVQKYQLL